LAFLDPTDPVVAALTDVGRTNLARMVLGDIAFNLTAFAVGRGGYNPLNPVKITSLNLSLTALEDQVFPTIPTLKAIELIELPTPKTTILNCRLASTEAQWGLGEIGIWGTILNSPIPVEIGQTFLFAIAHFPLQSKTDKQVALFRIIVQY